LDDHERHDCEWEEDTISYDELVFFYDSKRRLLQAASQCAHNGRQKPLLYTDLDRFFDDRDAMMA
jgi:hypothetical protein